jgi:hypothetical protein
MNFEEYRILGAIIDNTFGSDYKDAGAFKTICKLVGESKMVCTCMVVVNLSNRQDMQKECSKSYDQLDKVCNQNLKRIKTEFKKQAGRALKTKQTGQDQSVELINMSSYSPKGTALVRCVYTFEVK